MKDSKSTTNLKLLLISLAQDLKQGVVSFDLIQQATILLTDQQPTVRSSAAAMFEAYFEAEPAKATNGSNDNVNKNQPLQVVLLDMFRCDPSYGLGSCCS